MPSDDGKGVGIVLDSYAFVFERTVHWDGTLFHYGDMPNAFTRIMGWEKRL